MDKTFENKCFCFFIMFKVNNDSFSMGLNCRDRKSKDVIFRLEYNIEQLERYAYKIRFGFPVSHDSHEYKKSFSIKIASKDMIVFVDELFDIVFKTNAFYKDNDKEYLESFCKPQIVERWKKTGSFYLYGMPDSISIRMSLDYHPGFIFDSILYECFERYVVKHIAILKNVMVSSLLKKTFIYVLEQIDNEKDFKECFKIITEFNDKICLFDADFIHDFVTRIAPKVIEW